MITTRRNGYEVANDSSARGGIDVLERSYANVNSVAATTESDEQARAKMQENLDRLMNYDRYAEIEAEEQAVKTELVEEPVKAHTDDDIRPTSTTMQFGDGDVSQVYNDLEKSKERKESYKLNGKGKLVVALYALAVTVILALIVLNTGLLKALDGQVSALTATYAEKSASLAAQTAEIEAISSDAYITELAENEFGMIKR